MKIPTKIRLFKAGENETTKGTFVFNPEQAQAILEASNKSHSKFPIDVAHLSLTDAGNPDAHISVGWFDLEVTDEGIFASNIEWTDRGQSYLKNKEFRYISPAFQTNEDNEVVFIENFALTNSPATYNADMMLSKENSTDDKKPLHKILIEVTSQDDDASKEQTQMLDTQQKTQEDTTEVVVEILDQDGNTVDSVELSTEAKLEDESVEVPADETPAEDAGEEVEAETTVVTDAYSDMSPEEMKAMLDEKAAMVLSLEEQVRALTEEISAFKQGQEMAEKDTMLGEVQLSDSEKAFYLKTLSKEQVKEFVELKKAEPRVRSTTTKETTTETEDVSTVVNNVRKEFLSKASPTVKTTTDAKNNSTVRLSSETEARIKALAEKIRAKR